MTLFSIKDPCKQWPIYNIFFSLYQLPLYTAKQITTFPLIPFIFIHSKKQTNQKYNISIFHPFLQHTLSLSSSSVQLHLLLSREVAQPNCRGEWRASWITSSYLCFYRLHSFTQVVRKWEDQSERCIQSLSISWKPAYPSFSCFTLTFIFTLNIPTRPFCKKNIEVTINFLIV